MNLLSKVSRLKINYLGTKVEIRSALNVLGLVSNDYAETKNKKDVFEVLRLSNNLNNNDRIKMRKSIKNKEKGVRALFFFFNERKEGWCMEEKTYTELVKYANELREKIKNGEGDEKTHNQYMEVMNLVTEIHNKEMEYWDKEQRRNDEKEKNEKNAEIELKKANLDWKRITLEISKVAIPVVVGSVLHCLDLSTIWGVEKDGRMTTDYGRRIMNFAPKFWK